MLNYQRVYRYIHYNINDYSYELLSKLISYSNIYIYQLMSTIDVSVFIYIYILSPANVNPGLINHGLIREVFPQ